MAEKKKIGILRDFKKFLVDLEASNWIKGGTVFAPIASALIDTEEDAAKYAFNKYQIDKKTYLESGTWPTGMFYNRDTLWNYYYFYQLTDMSIELDKYFDFDYDTSIFDRNKLLESVHIYGMDVILHFYSFMHSRTKKSFDEYMADKAISSVRRNKVFNKVSSTVTGTINKVKALTKEHDDIEE